MKRIAAALILFSVSSVAVTQTVSYESVRLSDLFLDSSWKTLEQSLPPLMLGLESQLKTGGATEKASKVLTEEIRRAVTRENLSKSIAQALTEKFTGARRAATQRIAPESATGANPDLGEVWDDGNGDEDDSVPTPARAETESTAETEGTCDRHDAMQSPRCDSQFVDVNRFDDR